MLCCFFENGLGEALIGWALLFVFTTKLLLLCLQAVSKLKVHLSKSEIVPMVEFEDNSHLWQISYVVPRIADL